MPGRKRIPTLLDLRNGIGREGKPLTQQVVAHRARMNQSYLSQIERGMKKASPRPLWRLAQLYGVPYERILEIQEHTYRSLHESRTRKRVSAGKTA